MSTAVGIPASTGAAGDNPQRRPAAAPVADALWKVLKTLASLRLTVALFGLSMLLVFFGTLAQLDKGTWSVVKEYFRSWYVWVPFQLIAEFLKKFFDLPKEAVWSRSFPFPGGWLLGGVMLVNLLAAHLTRFKLSWRRSGIIVLHAGVILLMVGELITGLYAVESRMTLLVGESKNFIDDSHRIELAFTNQATHQTATIPQGMLTKGDTVRGDALPVDVEVMERYKNTTLSPVSGGDDSNTIVSVNGGRYRVVPAAEESGVKSEQREDVPGVRVRLLEKGTQKVLAERMCSLWEYESGPATGRFLTLPATVSVNGQTYSYELRNERIYEPYTIKLLKFEHAKYAGTEMARDFASTVRLTDTETDDDREVRIWMNHPLRHRGETFYQQSTLGAITAAGEASTGTVLQVVKNPGWLLPYISCIVVTLGLLIHFGITLVKFTGKPASRQVAASAPVVDSAASPRMLAMKKYFPWVVIGLVGFYAAGKLAPRHDKYKDFDLKEFGGMPVLDSGRIKPLDSIARTTMLHISGRSDWTDPEGKTRPAIQWLLEVMAAGDPAAKPVADYRVFLIDNDQLLNQLELEFRPGSRRYSWNEIRTEKFVKLYMAAQADKLARQLTESEREARHQLATKGTVVVTGTEGVNLPVLAPANPSLVDSKDPPALAVYFEIRPDDRSCRLTGLGAHEVKKLSGVDSPKWYTMVETALRAIHLKDESKDQFYGWIVELVGRMNDYRQLAEGGTPTVIPTAPGSTQWMSLSVAEEQPQRAPAGGDQSPGIHKAVEAFRRILADYKENKPHAFAEDIGNYKAEYIYPLNPMFRDTTAFEQAFNAAYPFISAAFLYLFALVFIALSWLGWRAPLRQTAIGITLIALTLHGLGFLGRMYIMGRPLVFVTNLYSSGIWIGFAAVAGCLVLEQVFRNGLALFVGTAVGAITVKISHHLATDGTDTMRTLEAVLDTNFWLASHVTTVVLGYSATFVAALIAMGLIFQVLARVVVQSFQTPERMSAGEFAAYLAAVVGIALIPNLGVGVILTVAGSEEAINPMVSEMIMYLTLGLTGVLGVTLVFMRLAAIGGTGRRPDLIAAVEPIALDQESMTKLGQMTYGVVCFAMVLSFVGTVLGGIWADQSWGRFWGWDPKENGAVLIVIWNALILHARWCGLVKQRGMAVLAIAGIMVTTWSWFGTNQLGVGLHAYGFNQTLAEGCRYTWIVAAVLVAVGMVPQRYWNTYAAAKRVPVAEAPAPLQPAFNPSRKKSGKSL